jgi:hypothetical protein
MGNPQITVSAACRRHSGLLKTPRAENAVTDITAFSTSSRVSQVPETVVQCGTSQASHHYSLPEAFPA